MESHSLRSTCGRWGEPAQSQVSTRVRVWAGWGSKSRQLDVAVADEALAVGCVDVLHRTSPTPPRLCTATSTGMRLVEPVEGGDVGWSRPGTPAQLCRACCLIRLVSSVTWL